MKVAVLGLGNAGFDLHLPALAGLPGVTVSGAVDPDAARRNRAAAAFKVPVFESFDALRQAGLPDVVVVATPPRLHVEHCLQALAAGTHVVCEKPFAPSVADAERIVAAGRAAQRQVALNHEFRVMPIFRAVMDQVGRPGVGELVFVQAWQNMDLPPWKEPNWRSGMLMGTLYEAGLHLVDYVIALFREEPVAVSATMSSCGARPEASDAAALVTMEFSRGRLAQVIQNRLCPGETQYFEVRADAAQASLRASFGGRARVSAGLLRSTRPHVRVEIGASGVAWRETGHRRQMIARNPGQPAMAATRALLAQTFAAFERGTAPPASAADGCQALRVLAACYRSAASGRRVVLADDATLAEHRFEAAH